MCSDKISQSLACMRGVLIRLVFGLEKGAMEAWGEWEEQYLHKIFVNPASNIHKYLTKRKEFAQTLWRLNVNLCSITATTYQQSFSLKLWKTLNTVIVARLANIAGFGKCYKAIGVWSSKVQSDQTKLSEEGAISYAMSRHFNQKLINCQPTIYKMPTIKYKYSLHYNFRCPKNLPRAKDKREKIQFWVF